MIIKLGEKLPLHANLNKIHRAQAFWNSSYSVDAYYIDGKDVKGKPIINRFTCETTADYNERKDRTSARNYIGGIINSYVSAVFRNDPERDESIVEFAKNADGKGTSLSQLMAKATMKTLINGFVPVIYESEISGATLSIAQARLANANNRLVVADPMALLNFVEVDGFLLEALISFVDENGKAFARHYTDTYVQDIYFDVKSYQVKSVSEPMEHGLTKIPVVLMRIDVAYDSFVAPLAESQKKIANYQSLVATELYEQTFTRFIISGIENPNEGEPNSNLNMGSKRLMTTPSNGVAVSKLSSDISQADSIRKSIADEELALYKTAGQAHDDVSANASGAARVLAKDGFYIIANLISGSVEATENYFLSLMADQQGITYEPSYYSRTYEEPDWLMRITELRDVLSLNLPEDIKAMAIAKFQADFF